MSLGEMYLEHLKERMNGDVVLTDSGYIAYKIEDFGESKRCFISDTHVMKIKRGDGKFREMFVLLTSIAQQAGCKYIYGYLMLNDPGVNETLATALAVGFKLGAADPEKIAIVFDLGE